MDDEVARPNIKEELTTREEYLDTRFKRLSSSGHDLTPIDTVDWIMLILSGANLDFLGVRTLPHLPPTTSPLLTLLSQQMSQVTWNEKTQAQTDGRVGCRYLGDGQKGLYVCAIGGLPLFASGTRIEEECTAQQLVFSEPCDPDHITLVTEDNISSSSDGSSSSSSSSGGTVEQRFKCTRSDTPLGIVYTINSSTGSSSSGGDGPDGGDSNNNSNKKYVISDLRSLRFLSLDAKWPVESQPENAWGTEGQVSMPDNHRLSP